MTVVSPRCLQPISSRWTRASSMRSSKSFRVRNKVRRRALSVGGAPKHDLNPHCSTGGNVMSALPKLTSDFEGLAHQVDPLSRRGFFLAASAATAAGYTLAAGPVRADAIHTDSAGLTAGEAKVKVSDGEMPVYYARPANAQDPPVIL